MKNILLLIHDNSGQGARLQAALDVTRAIDEVDDGSVKAGSEEAAAYLSRHGIHASILRVEAKGDASETLLMAKANSGRFDYVLMGGFSHSRLYEAVFGGVTRRLLTYSQIPFFLAH